MPALVLPAAPSAGAPAAPPAAARRATPLAWLLLAPLLLWLAVFVLVPTAFLAVESFCRRDDLGRVVYSFTWDNWRRVLDPIYRRVLGRSLGYAALATALCAVLGWPVAWVMARSRAAVRGRLLLLVMIPFWTSFLIRTYAWIAILKGEGLLNGVLLWARLIPRPLELLYTPVAVVLGLVYAYLPFMILPIYGSAEKLDPALVEAAHDLGAGPFGVFWRVLLPLTRPGLMAGVLLVFVPAIGMFAITDLMGGAQVPLIGGVIQDQFLKARNGPFGSALGMVLTLGFAVVYAWFQRRGEHGGREP
jgi:spermidine/putrescine transport system permease protein